MDTDRRSSQGCRIFPGARARAFSIIQFFEARLCSCREPRSSAFKSNSYNAASPKSPETISEPTCGAAEARPRKLLHKALYVLRAFESSLFLSLSTSAGLLILFALTRVCESFPTWTASPPLSAKTIQTADCFTLYRTSALRGCTSVHKRNCLLSELNCNAVEIWYFVNWLWWHVYEKAKYLYAY